MICTLTKSINAKNDKGHNSGVVTMTLSAKGDKEVKSVAITEAISVSKEGD